MPYHLGIRNAIHGKLEGIVTEPSYSSEIHVICLRTMAEEKNNSKELNLAYEQFKNCLHREKLVLYSTAFGILGAAIGGYAGKLPGAFVGGVLGYGTTAIGIGYNCYANPQTIDIPRLPAIQTAPEQIRG